MGRKHLCQIYDLPDQFCFFFRFDEISNLRESDVIFFDDHLEIYIESSKTDQYRDGAWVVIARTSSGLCPVLMLERYVKMAAVGKDADKFLFRGLLHTKDGATLRPTGGLSYGAGP